MTTTIRGACGHDCPDTCSWLVTVSDGKAQTLVGDPAHPFTRGGLCAKVNDYLDRVYHKDRVLYPLRRKGPKGAGEFERVSWDEALADVAARWNQIVASDGAEAILPYSLAGTQGLIQMASLGERLFGSMGTTRLIRDICGEVAVAGLSAANGTGMGIDPEDIVHSRFIVLWGTNTIVTNLHLWPVILEARRRGAKVIVIDPVRTRTAAAADWHIAPKPASDGALALAMMHVILREGLVDHDYVQQYANGFETLVDRAREYSPERAAGITGIDADEIEKFAREYATTQPSLIRPLIGLEHHRNGATLFRTIACLPVLTGAWRHRGGGLQRSTGALQYSTLDVGRVRMPELNKPGARTMNMRDLGCYLCSPTLAPPIRSLMVYNCNPLVTNPNQNLVRRGLAREDLFTVVHDLFVTETARYADYVLPAASQVECLDIVPAWGHHYLSMNQPAIAPLGESVSNTELFRMLARALGRTEPWLFESDESMLRAALASGHPWLDGITYERLQAEGYVRLRQPEDWRPFALGGFQTPDGKAILDPAAGEIIKGDGLQLITGKQLHFLNGSYNQMERHQRRAGELEIELNSEDAAVRGLRDGELVRVHNEFGSLTARCRISTAIARGVASMPFGGNADAAGASTTVNVLTPEMETDNGEGSGFYDAFVEVSGAGGWMPQAACK